MACSAPDIQIGCNCTTFGPSNIIGDQCFQTFRGFQNKPSQYIISIIYYYKHYISGLWHSPLIIPDTSHRKKQNETKQNNNNKKTATQFCCFFLSYIYRHIKKTCPKCYTHVDAPNLLQRVFILKADTKQFAPNSSETPQVSFTVQKAKAVYKSRR